MALTPVTRTEIYLATASGDYSGDLPEPITREEMYLKKIAENGSGGSADAYTKSETDTLLTAKADKATTYTKTETDARITEKVAEIVSDAPEDFDTLKEMSDWIDSHEDSAAAMNTAIQANTTAITGKVDKETGKGLSTNDFTTSEKVKLSDCQTGWIGTESEYSALTQKDFDLYFIHEDDAQGGESGD